MNYRDVKPQSSNSLTELGGQPPKASSNPPVIRFSPKICKNLPMMQAERIRRPAGET